MSVRAGAFIIETIDDQQVFGERHLSLAQNGRRLRQQFLRWRALKKRHVALTADRQQQRVHAGCIDGVDFFDPR